MRVRVGVVVRAIIVRVVIIIVVRVGVIVVRVVGVQELLHVDVGAGGRGEEGVKVGDGALGNVDIVGVVGVEVGVGGCGGRVKEVDPVVVGVEVGPHVLHLVLVVDDGIARGGGVGGVGEVDHDEKVARSGGVGFVVGELVDVGMEVGAGGVLGEGGFDGDAVLAEALAGATAAGVEGGDDRDNEGEGGAKGKEGDRVGDDEEGEGQEDGEGEV